MMKYGLTSGFNLPNIEQGTSNFEWWSMGLHWGSAFRISNKEHRILNDEVWAYFEVQPVEYRTRNIEFW